MKIPQQWYQSKEPDHGECLPETKKTGLSVCFSYPKIITIIRPKVRKQLLIYQQDFFSEQNLIFIKLLFGKE